MGLWDQVKGALGAKNPAPPARKGAAFDAAGTGRRAKGWVASTEGINSLLFTNAEILRNRTRDAVRKNPWAANAIDSYVANAVGTGIKPLSQHPDPAIRDRIHAAWLHWTDESDFDGLTDYYGQQALACRSMKEAGEVLVRMHVVPDLGLSVPLQLQILEADHLPLNTWPGSNTPDIPEGNSIRSGIEFDPAGRRVAYHLYREHPGETIYFNKASGQTVRVPATEILHVFRPLRPGQLRGQTDFAPVLVKLYELDIYDDAELVRKKVAALFCGIVKKVRPEDQIIPETENDGEGHAEASLEPGTLQYLEPDEDIAFPQVPDSGGYELFMRAQLRAIAAGLGITYEMLTGDLTGVNYSSIRAGLLEFRRKCEQFQHSVLVFQLCRRVFKDWLKFAVLSGAVDLPGYAQNPAQYEAVRWITPGWAWVDPLKDAMASQLAVENGFTTRSQVVSERGDNVEDVDRENAADKAREKELGLRYGDPKVIAQEVAAENNDNPAAVGRQQAIREAIT